LFIAVIAVLKRGPGLLIHAERAFKLGATKEEVIEAIYHENALLIFISGGENDPYS